MESLLLATGVPERDLAALDEQWSSATDAATARSYFSAGLGPYELQVVKRCLAVGLKARDLRREIRGQMILRRLTSNEGPELLAIELQDVDRQAAHRETG